jgi:hypothetical protein
VFRSLCKLSMKPLGDGPPDPKWVVLYLFELVLVHKTQQTNKTLPCKIHVLKLYVLNFVCKLQRYVISLNTCSGLMYIFWCLNVLCIFFLVGHMSCAARSCPCSCCCPYCRTLDRFSRPTTCSSMPSNSTCVWRCLRTVLARCQRSLSCP